MPESFLKIEGSKALFGEITIGGSKNSMSALIPALCLGKGEGILRNVPEISDVDSLKGILRELCLEIDFNGDVIRLTGDICYNRLSTDHAGKIRASNLFLGVLLSKFGKAQVPIPGGDRIGTRPHDIHFHIFSKFGIRTEVKDGYINCEATEFPYEGQTLFLRYPSVGATENAMMIASHAKSPSTIYNAAMEPEITDLAILLNKMGASIMGAGTPIMRIRPAPELIRVEHEIIPDRLEAGTFLFYIAATRGKGVLRNVIPEHLISVISILSDCGAMIEMKNRDITIDATGGKDFPAVTVMALPYPGLPTDLQPFVPVFASTCIGDSLILDTVFRDRFLYLYEMKKMGLVMDHAYDQVKINGPQQLTGADLTGGDIRMTAALIMGALIANGESRISGLDHLNRGYGNFIKKIQALHANIELSNGL